MFKLFKKKVDLSIFDIYKGLQISEIAKMVNELKEKTGKDCIIEIKIKTWEGNLFWYYVEGEDMLCKHISSYEDLINHHRKVMTLLN